MPALHAQSTHSADCQACALAHGRTRIVNPDGPADALLAVGEGPGADEDRLGVGFVGSAGRTLAAAIEALSGLDRDQWARTNLVRCRPPDNRTPTQAEIRLCAPWLDLAVEQLAPRVLLAVGESAGRRLCGDALSRRHAYLPQVEALIACRAPPDRAGLPEYRGIPVVPMPHTSGLAWNRWYLDHRGERRRIADLGRSCIAVALAIAYGVETPRPTAASQTSGA